MNIGVIIQARTKSSRFHRKIYEDINGKYTLQRVLDGTKKSIIPHKIVLAMPEYDRGEFERREYDGEFLQCCDNRFSAYFGHPDDLVDRYFHAARKNCIDLVIRITADNPLIQGNIIDEMLCEYLKKSYNGFMGNNIRVSSDPYPEGVDIEIFSYWMLAETYILSSSPFDRENVCPFMYRRGTEYNLHPFLNCRPNTMISMKFRDFSFDTYEDLQLVKAITKEYDKHEDLNKAIENTNFQIKTCRVNDYR